jgi:hypothetical protein
LRAKRACSRAAPQACRAAKRYRPHHRPAKVLLHFGDQRWSKIPFDRDGLIDRGQHRTGEGQVDDRAVDSGDTPRP